MNSSLDREIKEFQRQLVQGLLTQKEAYNIIDELEQAFIEEDYNHLSKIYMARLLIPAHFNIINYPKRQLTIFDVEGWHRALGDKMFKKILTSFEITTNVKGADYIEEFEKSLEEPEPLISPEKINRMIKGMIERYDRKRSI